MVETDFIIICFALWKFCFQRQYGNEKLQSPSEQVDSNIFEHESKISKQIMCDN